MARVHSANVRRIHKLLKARADGDDDALAREEPLLSQLSAASLQARIATGIRSGWKYGGMDVSEAKKLRELERENTELKKMVAELSLDNRLLKELNSKKW